MDLIDGEQDINAFPVYTGINRTAIINFKKNLGVPCIHRDKPGFGVHWSGNTVRSLYTQG